MKRMPRITVRDLQMLSCHSQRALAVKLGVSAATVCNILNGRPPKNWAAIRPVLEDLFTDHAADGATVKKALDAITANPLPKPEDEPVILRKQSLTPNARRHFNLSRNPFAEPQTVEDIYISPEMRYVRDALWGAAKFGDFLAIVGESGSGKTTLELEMEERINADGEPITVIRPCVLGLSESEKTGRQLKARDIGEAVLMTVAPGEKIPASTEQLFRKMRRILTKAQDRKHLLVLEEAHECNAQTFKILKRFWEERPEDGGMRRLLSVVIIGQPELEGKLNASVREATQRCEIVRVPAMPDLGAFLKFRFSRVGVDFANVFTPDAVDEMRQKLIVNRDSSGRGTDMAYPLAAQNLAAACMNLAAEYGEKTVTADVVREVRSA